MTKKAIFLFLFLAPILLSAPEDCSKDNYIVEKVEAPIILEREQEKALEIKLEEEPVETPVIDTSTDVSVKTSTNDSQIQEGVASWYGSSFHGKKTASGEIYDMHDLTAAHRDLKFGTMVRVTHSRSGRYVDVKINDRGPYTKGRIIDLSAQAAQQIGIQSEGVAKVKVEVIETP